MCEKPSFGEMNKNSLTTMHVHFTCNCFSVRSNNFLQLKLTCKVITLSPKSQKCVLYMSYVYKNVSIDMPKDKVFMQPYLYAYGKTTLLVFVNVFVLASGDDSWFITDVVYAAKMANICWFKLLKCGGFLYLKFVYMKYIWVVDCWLAKTRNDMPRLPSCHFFNPD